MCGIEIMMAFITKFLISKRHIPLARLPHHRKVARPICSNGIFDLDLHWGRIIFKTRAFSLFSGRVNISSPQSMSEKCEWMGRTAIIIHATAVAKGQTRRAVAAFWRMLLALRGKSRHHLHSSSSLSFAAAIMAARRRGPTRLELSLLSTTMETFHSRTRNLSLAIHNIWSKWVSVWARERSERGSFQFHMPTTGNVIFFLSASHKQRRQPATPVAAVCDGT